MNPGTIQWGELLFVLGQIGYFSAAFVLNLFLFMIGNFYRKKLGEKIPLGGFITAMLALIVALVGTIVGDLEYGRMIAGFALVTAGSFTLLNGTFLYISMRREYK